MKNNSKDMQKKQQMEKQNIILQGLMINKSGNRDIAAVCSDGNRTTVPPQGAGRDMQT